MKRIITSLFLSILLISCGGSDSSSDKSESNPIDIVKTTTGLVELGPVINSQVQILTLEGNLLLETTTDEKGNFKVEVNKLKEKVDTEYPSISLVKVVSTGGTDIDPNDDGVIVEAEKKQVNGSVTSIVPLSIILNEDGYSTNLLTSFFTELLQGKQNLTQSEIEYLAKTLLVSDIDLDNKITIRDLLFYSMKEHDSSLETELRDKVLSSIHSGSSEEIINYISNVAYDYTPIEPEIETNNGSYTVNLIPIFRDSHFLYSINPDIDYVFEEYNSTLTLFDNDTLYYKECTEEGYCYKTNKIFFKDGTFLLNTPIKEYEAKSLTEGGLDDYWKTIQAKEKELADIEEELARLKG